MVDEYDPIPDLAAMIAGLQAPVSLHVPIGAAREAWERLHRELVGVGWASQEQVEQALRESLRGAK